MKGRQTTNLIKKTLTLTVLVVFSFLSFSLFSSAATAPLNIITYQGRLLDSTGAEVVAASASMSFAFYNAVSGGTCLWSNNSTTCASIVARTVTLTNALFTENLGDTTDSTPYAAINDTVFANNASVYLEVIVNGETLTPRKRITAAAYALNAQSLDGLDSTALHLFEVGTFGTYEDDAATIIGSDSAFTYGSGAAGDLKISDELEVIGHTYLGGDTDAYGYILARNDFDVSLPDGKTSSFSSDASGTTDIVNIIQQTIVPNADALSILLTQDNGATAGEENMGLNMNLNGNDADGDILGIYINAQNTANAAAGTYKAGIKIANWEDTVGSMPDAISIIADVLGNITDAIDVSSDNIINALNIGSNIITGGAGTIDFSEFDVDGGTGSVTINDGGNLGQISIEGSVFDIDSLTFAGSGAINSTGANDIDVNIGNSNNLFQVLTGNFQIGNGTPDITLDGESAYIGSGLEVDGNTRLDGNLDTYLNVSIRHDLNIYLPDGETVNIQGDGTATSDAFYINQRSIIANTDAISVLLTQNDGATTGQENLGLNLSIEGNDADGDVLGISIMALPTTNAAAGTYKAGLRIDNEEETVASMTDAIIINALDDASITDAFDASNSYIVNALNIGSNTILGTNGVIDFSEFDVDGSTGSITINDGGNLGQISIESSILDINSLDFVGLGGITTGSNTDLTITPGGSGDLLFPLDSDTQINFQLSGTTGSMTPLKIYYPTGQTLAAGASIVGQTVDLSNLTLNAGGNSLTGLSITTTDYNPTTTIGIDLEGLMDRDIDLMNDEYISNSDDDLISFTGTGGANNTNLVFDFDGVSTTVPTIYSSISGIIAFNETLSIGVDGSAGHGIYDSGFGLTGGNDLYVTDMLGVNGLAFFDNNINITDDIQIIFGDSDDATISWAVGGVGSNDFLFDNTNTAGSTIFRLGTDTSATDLQILNNSNIPLFAVSGAGGVDLETSLTIDAPATPSTQRLCASSGGGDALALNDIMIVDCSDAGQADFAEMYPVASDATYGDIVVPGLTNIITEKGEIIVQMVKSTSAYQNIFGGIVVNNYEDGTSAGYNISDSDNPMPISLVGRVPVHVTNEGGSISIGDPITTSSTAGYGMKASEPGMIIGYALNNFSEISGEVMVFVHSGWYAGNVLTTDGSATLMSDTLVMNSLNAADGATPGVASQIFALRGSGWDGEEDIDLDMKIQTQVTNSSDYRLSVKNTTGAEVAYISNEGTMMLAGDLIITGKFYPSDRGVAQTSKYIYYDGSIGPGGDMMRTNAAGWSTGSYDFAEMFSSTDVLEAGDVVVFSQNEESVGRSAETYSQKIAGIVSTRPGFLAGENKAGQFPIALAGRVPTKVNLEGGTIAIGDPLTTSSTAGYAMKASEAGQIVGYALEAYSGSGNEKIIVFVNVGYFDGTATTSIPGISNNASLLATGASANFTTLNLEGDIYMGGNDILNIGRLVGLADLWSIEEDGTIRTQGTLKTVITSYQNEKVEASALTSTSGVFVTLVGTTELQNGLGLVTFEDIDPYFNDVISNTAPIRVIVTPSGPVSLYVSDKNQNGFTIQQIGGNDSGIQVDWMVTAYRKDFEPQEENEPIIEEQQPTETTNSTSETITETPEAVEEVLVVEETETFTETTEPVIDENTEPAAEVPAESPIEPSDPTVESDGGIEPEPPSTDSASTDSSTQMGG